MAVSVFGSLRSATDGAAEVEIEAKNLRELLDGLAEHYPGMRPQLKRGVTVAIDGKNYNDSWFQPIEPESEVVILPRIVGG